MQAQQLAVLFGLAGAAFSLSMVLPQAALIWRDRSYAGVSLGSWLLLTLTASTWAGFALRTGNVALGLGNTSFLLACWWVLVAASRADGYPSPRTAFMALVVLTADLLAFLTGLAAPLGLVVIIGVAASFVRTPQVIRSYQTWRASGPSEVSRTSLWIGFAGNCSWTLHGILRGDPFVTLSAGCGTAVAASIITVELAAQRRRIVLPESLDPELERGAA